MKTTLTPPLYPFLIFKSVINFCKSTHPPIPPPIHDCDAVGVAFNYWSEFDHLPEAGNIYIGIHPSANTLTTSPN
jgi:hypothetical protein